MKKYLILILFLALISLRISVIFMTPENETKTNSSLQTVTHPTEESHPLHKSTPKKTIATAKAKTMNEEQKKSPISDENREESVSSYPEDKYLKSIKIGGEWFLNNQNDTFLHYQYNIYEKKHPKEDQHLRQMGALWSITNLAKYLEDKRYQDLADKGFAYFEKYLKYDQENDFMYVNITPKDLKIGYSAFIILALIEIDHPKKDYYLEKLANGLIFQQNEDGELRTFFYSNKDSGKDYYPGESLVALMTLYEYTKNERYLDVVKKAFPHYAEYFRNNKNTAFIPWQSRAYYKLFQATRNPLVAEFIFEMNDWMLEQNQPRNGCSDFAFPMSGTTSVYMEGVNKAYDLALMINDKERAKCYSNYIREGANYMLTLQIPIDTDLEKEAIGGFLGSKESDSLRVDRNQHAVMALMEATPLTPEVPHLNTIE